MFKKYATLSILVFAPLCAMKKEVANGAQTKSGAEEVIIAPGGPSSNMTGKVAAELASQPSAQAINIPAQQLNASNEAPAPYRRKIVYPIDFNKLCTAGTLLRTIQDEISKRHFEKPTGTWWVEIKGNHWAAAMGRHPDWEKPYGFLHSMEGQLE